MRSSRERSCSSFIGVSAMGFAIDVSVLVVLSPLFLVLGAWAFSRIQA